MRRKSFSLRNAWSGQVTDEALPDRPDNLFKLVDGDFGAHGRFDQEARTSSSQLRLAMHPALSGFLAGAAAVLLLALVVALLAGIF
jgi:hypothetical protein